MKSSSKYYSFIFRVSFLILFLRHGQAQQTTSNSVYTSPDSTTNRVEISGELNVEKTIQISSASNENPPAGTIRWNEETMDFEGFDGTSWRSFTRGERWGETVAVENDSLTSFDGQPLDMFGQSVAITDEFAVVGAPRHGTSGFSSAGKVYVYERDSDSWSEPRKFWRCGTTTKTMSKQS